MGDYVDQVNYAEHTWDNDYELILVDRGDKAKCMGWLCTHTSNYYNNQRRMLLVPASAVSWFLNVFGMFATYLGKEKISEPLVILIVSLGNFIVATLTTIAEQGKAGDKVELFNQTSRDYNLIASEINHQIRLPPYNRKPVMKVLIDTEKRYNDLIKSTPNIPEPITKDFTQRYTILQISATFLFVDELIDEVIFSNYKSLFVIILFKDFTFRHICRGVHNP